jgi:glycerate-2-kinase
MLNLKEEAKTIFLDTLKRIDLTALIKSRLKVKGEVLSIDRDELDLSAFNEIVLVGMGKASLNMGAALERLLKGRIARGLLVTDSPHDVKVLSDVIVAGHPLPDANSLEAGDRIIEMVGSCGSRSLIIFLISGGGSALVESPLSPDVTLEDVRELNRLLVHCGASIREINVVRKHFSQIKGGRLGKLAARAQSIALYVSDVNSDDLRSVASNPLVEDDATLAEFFEILERFDLTRRLPGSIRRLIEESRVPELPKGDDRENNLLKSLLLLDNRDAMRAAAQVARERGYRVEIDFEHAEGKYQQVADELLLKLLSLQKAWPGEKVCLVSGGEVSCPVRGSGIGGRNQEFVLYCGAKLSGIGDRTKIAVLSCGTDGIDGNSNAAGATVTAETISAANAQGVKVTSYLEANDSHSFFKRFGGLVVTGPTGNNVRDIRVFLAQSRSD